MKDITNFLQNYEKKEAQFMKKETRSKGRKIEKLKTCKKSPANGLQSPLTGHSYDLHHML
jgi:hypothetical protein